MCLGRPFLMMLLIAISCAGEVAEIDQLYLLDAERGRNIGVKIYHPVGTGLAPVVVFSHGLGGSQWGYSYLGRHLASQGIISIHTTHPGSDWLLWDGKGRGAAMLNLRKAVDQPGNWLDRPRDIAFVLDRLDELERQAPALAGRFDRTRIAVAGHSFGAYTALACAGLKPSLPDAPNLDLADPRPIAFVAMSPQGHGGFLPVGCMAGVTRPVLLISGTEDDQPFSGSGHGLPWRMQAWDELPIGAKWLAVLDGATHMTFSGGGMGEKADPPKLEAVCSAVSGFLASRFAGTTFEPPVIPGVTWTAGVQVERER